MMTGLLLLAACNAAPGPANAGNTAAGNQVVLDILSWGKLVSHWQVNPDGSGEIWRVADGGTMSEYDIRKFNLHMDAPVLARFVAASNAFKRATRRSIACKVLITDMYYGDIVWSGGGLEQKFSFNYGCRSKAMDRAFDMLQQVNEIVSKQAAIDAEPYVTVPNVPR
jgi:hypothetical protein